MHFVSNKDIFYKLVNLVSTTISWWITFPITLRSHDLLQQWRSVTNSTRSHGDKRKKVYFL